MGSGNHYLEIQVVKPENVFDTHAAEVMGIDVVRTGLGPTPMLYFAEATLEVDGGVNDKTASRCIAAGATALVAGTAVYGGDPSKIPSALIGGAIYAIGRWLRPQ